MEGKRGCSFFPLTDRSNAMLIISQSFKYRLFPSQSLDLVMLDSPRFWLREGSSLLRLEVLNYCRNTAFSFLLLESKSFTPFLPPQPLNFFISFQPDSLPPSQSFLGAFGERSLPIPFSFARRILRTFPLFAEFFVP